MINSSRRIYKLYPDIAVTLIRALLVFPVCNNVSGPNWFLRYKLLKIGTNINLVQIHIINDANGRPVVNGVTIALQDNFGEYLVKGFFFVWQQLATYYIAGGELCDRFLNSIKLRKKVVQLDNTNGVPIVIKIPKYYLGTLPLPI